MSVYAEEGVRAHDLLEMAQRLECDPYDLINRDEPDQAEMAEGVSFVLDYCREYMNITPGAHLYPETRVIWGRIFTPIRKDLFGTADVTITAPTTHCVIDLKYGQGVVVEVVDNLQQLIYLLGVREERGPRDSYQVTIVQPRARHIDGPVRTTYITDKDLMLFAQRVREAVAAAEAPNAPRKAGEHCRWCPAAGVCPTLAEYSLQVAQQEFALADLFLGHHIAPQPVENLQTWQIAALLRQTPVVEAWMKALAGEAFGRANRGERVPGFKLVLGRSTREWDNDDVAKDALLSLGLNEDTIAPRQFVSPAKAEEAMVRNKIPVKNRKAVTQHIVKPPGAPTLASEIDPRNEYLPFSEFTEMPSVPTS